jgi:3-hydroxyisobutyrate dehydrogenase-like beta-hydroxyacid dehydrogenase
MGKIAFLGLGAMGSCMAPHLIKAGHDVTIWNRLPAAVATAVARGARSAATPREAAEGAEFVFNMLTDGGVIFAWPSRKLIPSSIAVDMMAGREAVANQAGSVFLICSLSHAACMSA